MVPEYKLGKNVKFSFLKLLNEGFDFSWYDMKVVNIPIVVNGDISKESFRSMVSTWEGGVINRLD